MQYKCEDCKDRGVIELLISAVPCDCRRGVQRSGDRPSWLVSYEDYERYASGEIAAAR